MTQIESRLAALRAAPPDGLVDGVLDRLGLVDEFVRAETHGGPVYVAFTASGVCAVVAAADEAEFRAVHARRRGRPLRAADIAPFGLAAALQAGDGGASSGVRVDLGGVSAFERDVLDAARRIPRGEVRSYAEVASMIGRPRAVRAVGSALGRNPVPVLVPCHRVIRSDGAPGEYVFGPAMKRRLLVAEGALGA